MRVMFTVPGINTDPQDPKNWGNRVAPVINQRGDWKVQPVLYLANEFDVGARESERVATCAQLMAAYGGVEMHGWAHSNGTRVLLGGQVASGCKLATVHLLCGACDADCDANGINDGLRRGLLGHVFAYVGSVDRAMRIEDTAAGKLLFDLPLGHQPLGLAGPLNVDRAVKDRVHVITWDGYDHSTWNDEEHFGGSVTQVMALAEMYGKAWALRGAVDELAATAAASPVTILSAAIPGHE